MTSVNETAGIWIRVSTGGQDETNQLPDVERHCAAHGYTIAKRYELNDIKASKGRQQIYQDQVVDDMRDGTINVLVCWNSDRLERRGPEALFAFLRKIKDAYGRIESTSEPLLGTEDLSGEATTALSAVIAHQESVKRSERQRISIDAAKGRGALYSIIPWAMETAGEKGHKQIIPTDMCREIVPQIFERCINGESLAQLAAWLDSEGTPTRRGTEHWSESTVRWIIRQRAYAGRWVNRKGEKIQECEAVVSLSTFDRAQQALKTRGKRAPTSKIPALLAKVKCARCGSPMYRVRSGNPGQKRYYYRCYGNMPQRRGCGNMVPLTQTDIIVIERVIAVSTDPHKIRTWVEGESYDDEISNAKQDLREAVEAEHWAEIPALTAKVDELRNKQERVTKGHYASTYIRKSDGSLVSEGEHLQYLDDLLTVGEHFNLLNWSDKREYLKTRDIHVEKVMPAYAPEGTTGIRVITDGGDHGVFIVPKELATFPSQG